MMKTYVAFLFTLLVGAGIGIVSGYQRGLKDGSAITNVTAKPLLSRPLYTCPPDGLSEFNPDSYWYLIMQDFGPI